MEIIKTKYRKNFKNSEISASSKYVIPIAENDINTHKFFNDITIINLSNSNIDITPDNDLERSFICPAKGNISFTFNDDNMKFTRLYITELDGAIIPANKINILIAKKRKEQVTEGL